MKVNLIIEIAEVAVFATYNSTWQRRAWAYVPHWDTNACLSGKQGSVMGEG